MEYRVLNFQVVDFQNLKTLSILEYNLEQDFPFLGEIGGGGGKFEGLEV